MRVLEVDLAKTSSTLITNERDIGDLAPWRYDERSKNAMIGLWDDQARLLHSWIPRRTATVQDPQYLVRS